MERKVNKLEHCHVEVEVVVDKETWKKAQDKAFEKASKDVTVKGFRKGHAPLNLVKEKVDMMKVMDEAINSLLPNIYSTILKEENIRPYARPEVNVTKISDTELEIKFTLVTAPEIELGQYKGLSIGKEEVKVTDEDIASELLKLQQQNAMVVSKEGAAENGDIVIIDFVGEVDGKQFDGGSASNYELELGSHSFVPGFEEQLVGVKANDTKDINIKFPENYVENLKGKDAVFHVTVHEVKTKQLPELDDAFVKTLNMSGVNTLQDLRNQRRAQLTMEKERSAKGAFINKVIDEVAKNSKIDIPDEIYNSQVEAMKEDASHRMSQSGLTLEQYLSIVGQSEEQYTESLKTQARKDVTGYFILDAIGQKEEITIEEADLEFEYAKMAEQYKMSIDDVKKALAPQLDSFKNSVRMSRIEDLLYKEND